MSQQTVTIRNKTKKLFEFEYDHVYHYLQPNQEWTVDAGVGNMLVKRWFRQLQVVGRGAYQTPAPLQNPNENKPSTPDWSNSRQEFCPTCGKGAEDIEDFEGHLFQHDQEAEAAEKKAQEPAKVESAPVVEEPAAEKRKAGRPRKMKVA